MILCDTSFLIGAINSTDSAHERCLQALGTIRHRLITTLPCLTEAMHLLGSRIGQQGQETLRGYLDQGLLVVAFGTVTELKRICSLMRIYADAPMDFADASLVAAAESLNQTRILTLDSHFYSYKIHGRIPFEVLP